MVVPISCTSWLYVCITKLINVKETEGVIKNEQSREHRIHKPQDEDKENKKHNTIYVGYHFAQTNTNNVNKTWTLLQSIGGKDEPNIVFMWVHETNNAKTHNRTPQKTK